MELVSGFLPPGRTKPGSSRSSVGISEAITNPNAKVLLIGGSSHVGKSTLAESLATLLGWTHVSTDRLARHPGRPWASPPRRVPDDVAEHYLKLSVDELIEDVLRHYEVNVWPKVEAIIASHVDDPTDRRNSDRRLCTMARFRVQLRLHQGRQRFGSRQATNCFDSGYMATATTYGEIPGERALIDKFLERTLVFNR